MNSKVNIFNINAKKEEDVQVQDGDIILVEYSMLKKELLMKVLIDVQYIKLISLSTQQVFTVERRKHNDLYTNNVYNTTADTKLYIVGICDLDIKIRNIIK